MILAGDIGGTHARLAVFEPDGVRLRPVAEATLPSREYAGPGEALATFLSAHPLPIERACFGVAGPVRGGRVEATNNDKTALLGAARCAALFAMAEPAGTKAGSPGPRPGS